MFPQPDKTLRTKENKAWLVAFTEANKAKGNIVISKSNYDIAKSMVDKLK